MSKKEIPRLSEDDIKTLAKGIVEGHVFTAMDCPPDMIGMVFMPVGMGGLADFDLEHIGCVYEWLDKAGERGINGYPIFLSCKVINDVDWDLTIERARKIHEAVEEAMK